MSVILFICVVVVMVAGRVIYRCVPNDDKTLVLVCASTIALILAGLFVGLCAA